MDSTKTVTIGLAIAGLAVGAALGARTRPISPPVSSPNASAPTTVAEGDMVVHVSGWVVSPGVVEVPVGSLVVEAIAAAGGALPGAGLDLINLAEPIKAGDQIAVPGPGEGGSSAGAENGLIRLNQANATELQALPGVGPVLAERIVDHRERNGPFQVVEDLLDVPGIGESKLSSIRDLVMVP